MTGALLALLLAAPARAAALSAPGRQAASLLESLVRLDTMNPPGSEKAACDLLAGFLGKAGVPYEVVTSSPGRANLVARLKGDGSRRPLLLLAHLDTVGVEPSQWSFPPLAGDEKDGFVRGRGSIDDKSMAASFAVVMSELARRKGTLRRDVVFAATADEESGGELGVRWLLKRRPELLDAELAVSEGGTSFTRGGKPLVLAVQVQEKGYLDVTLTARGAGGHAAVPDPDNAVLRLARALTRLDEWRPPARLSPVTRAYFGALRGLETPELSAAFDDLLSDDEERAERGTELVREHPYYGAMVADTWAPTMVAGGSRENVLPTLATANLNVRLLPGTSPRAFLQDLAAAIADTGVEAAPSGPLPEPPAAPMQLEGPFWSALRDAAAALSPAVQVVPSLSVGSTDAAFLRAKGVQVYGLEFPLAPEDQGRIHGADERMPLSGLDYGTRMTLRLAEDLTR